MPMSKIITVRSSDDEIFEVEEAVALQSPMIARMVEDDCVGDEIPITNVTGLILTKVIKYCKKHVVIPDVDDDSSSSTEVELKNWDAEFVKNMDLDTLYALINAANYLKINDLVDLISRPIADSIKDLSIEEIREIFNIKSDYTPEEEAAFRAENAWAFE